MNRLGVIPVVKLIVIHDRNDVIEPTDALELTAGRQLVDVLPHESGQNSCFFVVVGLYGTYVAVRTKLYGPAGATVPKIQREKSYKIITYINSGEFKHNVVIFNPSKLD